VIWKLVKDWHPTHLFCSQYIFYVSLHVSSITQNINKILLKGEKLYRMGLNQNPQKKSKRPKKNGN